MKCNDCGAVQIQGTSCPDCGGSNLLAEAGGDTITTSPAPGEPLSLPDSSAAVAMPPMPDLTLPVATVGPVVGTVVLPDKTRVELRENDEFLAAHESSVAPGLAAMFSDDTVSATPVRIFVKEGKMYATGGGSNGFSIITTVRYQPGQEVELPRGANISVGVGKNSKLVIK